jgi:CheY-like chemotaxis protein
LLVVDDEPEVLETAALLLGMDGHVVTTASSGSEALALLNTAASGDQPYAVVLTDLGMPGMNGRQLVAAMRAAGITTPCVLVTGWGMELSDIDVAAAGVQSVLPKPFSIAQLRAALAAAAASGAAS